MSNNNTVNNEDHPQYRLSPNDVLRPGYKTSKYFGATISFPDHTLLKPGPITLRPAIDSFSYDEVINKAIEILESRMTKTGITITCPDDTRKFLTLKLSELEHEVFAVMFLNNRHQLIKYEEMFRGTIDGASVYPREVAKRALQLNAAALIVAHNHPSGVPEPSKSDEQITHRLKDALGMLQIRLLDHVIVGGVDTVSMADMGII